jgi:hypothetical protein
MPSPFAKASVSPKFQLPERANIDPPPGSSDNGVQGPIKTEKSPFSDVVYAARKQKKISVADLIKVIPVPRNRFYDTVQKKNEWPEAGFPELCQLLELPFRSRDEARKLYEVGDYHGIVTGTRVKEAPFSHWLAQLDKQGKDLPGRNSWRVDPLILSMIGSMEKNHFWVGTTQELMLAPFSGLYPAVPLAIHKALDRRALFAFIIPTQKYIDAGQKRYEYDTNESFEKFQQRYQVFLDGYIEHLIKLGDPEPQYTAATRTQLFAWDDFRHTSRGTTVTLLGEYKAPGNVELRILLRVPIDKGQGSMLAPENRKRQNELQKFVRGVVTSKKSLALAPREKRLADARTEFISRLGVRMTGDGISQS